MFSDYCTVVCSMGDANVRSHPGVVTATIASENNALAASSSSERKGIEELIDPCTNFVSFWGTGRKPPSNK